MVAYDPFDYHYHDDPYPHYRALRDEAPAYFNEKHGVWFISRYADCQKAVRDFKTFSSAGSITLEPIREEQPSVQSSDPPDHTRLRHLMMGMFTPDAVAYLEESIRRMAIDLLTPFLESGRIDIIGDFSARLPMAIICRMLGFPREDEDMLRHLTDLVVHREDGVFGMPEEGGKATRALCDYFENALREREGQPPRADLVARLAAAEKAGQLSHAELIAYLFILSIAGNETTTKLIGNIVYQLHRHPAQRDALAADPSLVSSAVEETLRFDGPSQMLARGITRDVELHGKTLRAGQKVGLLFIAANRDERHYADAETFDIWRNPRDHLGFGSGLHACLGAALARLEARVAMEEILRLMPDFEVDEAGLARMHSPSVRGYTRVPLAFTNR